MSSKAEELFRKGLTSFKKGDFAGALGVFLRSLSLEPDVPSIHYNIAMAYLQLKDFGGAEKYLFEALKLDSSYGYALVGLANLRFLQCKREEAWRFLSSAAKTYLEDGVPSNVEEPSYFLNTFASLMKDGRVPKEIIGVMNDLLDVLVNKVPAGDVKGVLMLKLVMNFGEGLEEWKERDMRRRLKMKSAPINFDAPLKEVLFRYNKDSLVGMGKILRLQLEGSLEALKKAELVQKICARLRDLKFLRVVVEGLEQDEKTVLLDLVLKGGVTPWDEFAQHHGNDLEESIYWNWHPPKTLMGRLKARGLITEGSFNSKDWIFIPRELRPLLLAVRKLEIP